MKKVLLYIGIAIVAIGCTKNEIENTPTTAEISFSAGVTSRLSSTSDLVWDTDGKDEVGIFTNQTDDNQNLLFSVDKDGNMTSDSKLYPLDGEAGRTYYAYHPYDAAYDKTSTISISCTELQSNYLLWATNTSNATDVELTFKHMLPKVSFTLVAGGAEVSSLEEVTSARLKGAYTTADFDITTGEFSNQTTSDIILTFTKDNNYKITAYLIPMESEKVSEKVELRVVAGGDTYIYPFSTEYWNSGSEYNYTITVGESGVIND